MKHIYLSLQKQILTLAGLMLVSSALLANTITVAAGQTSTFNQDMNGTTIEVYGTLTFNPNNINGSNNRVTVYAGGSLIIPTSKNSLQNMTIDIRFDGAMTVNAPNFTFSNNGGIKNAGTINAVSTKMNINGNVGLENSGVINLSRLEIIDGAPSSGVLRKNTGSILITNQLLINGYFENAILGNIKVTGPCTGSNCGMTTNDRGNNRLVNDGSMEINGTTNINGPTTLNGTLIIIGDLNITKPLSGVNGKLGITNGVSKVTGDGRFQGTNMMMCDKNTVTNGFDQLGNPSQNTYTVNCSSVYAAAVVLPLRFVSFELVEYNKSSIYFKWVTTEEYNVDIVQLQGSTDGINYVAIENIRPFNTNGTHAYTSSKLESGRYSSYRVAVIDLDAKRGYSKIISHNVASQKTSVAIFPNPIVNRSFTVQLPSNEPAIVNVYSNDGKMLFTTSLKGQQQYQVKMNELAGKYGFLTIQVIQAGKIKSFNVINR